MCLASDPVPKDVSYPTLDVSVERSMNNRDVCVDTSPTDGEVLGIGLAARGIGKDRIWSLLEKLFIEASAFFGVTICDTSPSVVSR